MDFKITQDLEATPGKMEWDFKLPKSFNYSMK